MMRLFFFTAITIMSIGRAAGQSSFLPQSAGNGVNSEYHEIAPVLSPDGKILYFVRVNHPQNTFGELDSEDIWYSELQADGTWGTAQRLSGLNAARYNAVVAAPDNKTLYIHGVFNRKGNFWKKRGVSVTHKTGEGWSAPQKLKIRRYSKKDRGIKSSATASADGEHFIMAYTKWFNGERSDLWMSTRERENKWKKPRKIKRLSSGATEQTPFIAPDNKTLYFASDAAGKFQIYKSLRRSKDWKEWAEPAALSDTINFGEWASHLKTNATGSWAYYSAIQKPGEKANILRVKLFEENPFVIVSGRVLNKNTGKPVVKPYQIMVNGEKPDSVTINPDSSTYRIKLPLRKKYEASAEVAYHIPSSVTIDVSTEREFTTLKSDLYVTPLHYVRVKGNLLVRNNGQRIAAEASPRLNITNGRADSLRVDPSTATYEMTIAHSAVYDLALTASGYEQVPNELDLSLVNEYQEINLDLFVEEEKMVLVKGTVLDKKTGKPFTPASQLQVSLTGSNSFIAKIDTLTSQYQLSLPPGSVYTLGASSANYYPVFESLDLTASARGSVVSKELYLVPIEVGQSVRLNNIFFETGKAILKPASFPELDRVAEFLLQNTTIKVEIAGHTDNVGKAATNLKLSNARAKSVSDYILKKGVPGDRLIAKGYGLTKPVADNKTKEGKAQNRRVEFTILSK
jgi:outer membrane protein OmpA-like peptidoglycan-associated protein